MKWIIILCYADTATWTKKEPQQHDEIKKKEKKKTKQNINNCWHFVCSINAENMEEKQTIHLLWYIAYFTLRELINALRTTNEVKFQMKKKLKTARILYV